MFHFWLVHKLQIHGFLACYSLRSLHRFTKSIHNSYAHKSFTLVWHDLIKFNVCQFVFLVLIALWLRFSDHRAHFASNQIEYTFAIWNRSVRLLFLLLIFCLCSIAVYFIRIFNDPISGRTFADSPKIEWNIFDSKCLFAKLNRIHLTNSIVASIFSVCLSVLFLLIRLRLRCVSIYIFFPFCPTSDQFEKQDLRNRAIIFIFTEM